MMNHTDNTNRWALLIGINKYATLGSRYQLQGCVNDVELMAGILENNFRFPSDHITLLKDEEASREGILSAMDELVDTVGTDDLVVIHYSGHGSQMTDPDGDEPDGLDETIVPHDSGRRPHPNRDIRDDEIYEWLLRLTEKTSFVTLIFDCCHSGSITRDAFGELERWVEPDDRPLEELSITPVITEIVRDTGRDLGPSGWLPLGERYVLIAGCRDEESSYEHSVRQGLHRVSHGALTYFLGQELNQVSSGTTYRDVFERVSSQVMAAKPRQHPQMEGAHDRELFGVHEIEPMQFYPVSKREGNILTLAAGAAHGMTTGSQWEIYPQGTKLATDEARIGTVEINQVRAVTSNAEIKDEKEGAAIQEGARAVEGAHFYGEMVLSVEIQAPEGYEMEVEDLTNAIEESSLLKLVEDAQEAEVRTYILPPREEVSQEDDVPQLGPLDIATWAVIEDGRLIMPTHPVAEVGVVEILRKNLEKLIRYRQALALHNPNPEGLLKDKVDFTLLRQAQDDTWEEAIADDASGQIIYEEGERIAFRITNHHNQSIYISVLDFGLTGAISLLHPIEGASEQLRAGGSIEVGIREGDEIDLEMPEDFPYCPDPNDGDDKAGLETVKLYTTTHEADFSRLTQEGYRDVALKSVRGTVTPLGQLLGMALTGEGTRDARRNRVSPNEEWTTVERSFTLRRKLI